MGQIKLYADCSACHGTGVRHYFENHQEVVEDPCSVCGGTKLAEHIDGVSIDDTLIQQIIATLAAHTAELDYIHGKVTAIWNQVKP